MAVVVADSSEVTAQGIVETKLGQTLLNGNNIAMLIPGGKGPKA
jgi:U6 snRNA-associated Sm-like protein LSm5